MISGRWIDPLLLAWLVIGELANLSLRSLARFERLVLYEQKRISGKNE